MTSPLKSTPKPTRLPAWLVGSGVIAVAMGVMNVTTYGFTILAARVMGPPEYGALAAVMGLVLVVNVVSLGLQATGARRVSAGHGDLASIEADVLATSKMSAVALGLLALVVSPVVAVVLHLDSWTIAAMIAVTAVPLTIMGGQAGILQGERRWAPLAAIYLSVGIGRVGFGAIALLIDPTTLAAMTGVAVGAVVPVVIGWFALRHPSRTRDRVAATPAPPRRRLARGGVLQETAHNSHALLAFFALSNADVVAARITLDDHQAGLYAGGLILAKAVLFLPQFVVVIAFPSMASAGARRNLHLKGLALVLGIGLCAVAGAAVLSSLAVIFIGGPEYSVIRPLLWVFAGLGTLLAMIQLMVYDAVARQHKRAVFVIWAALAVVLGSVPFVNSVSALLSVVVTVDVTLFVVLLLTSLRRVPAATEPMTTAAEAQ